MAGWAKQGDWCGQPTWREEEEEEGIGIVIVGIGIVRKGKWRVATYREDWRHPDPELIADSNSKRFVIFYHIMFESCSYIIISSNSNSYSNRTMNPTKHDNSR